MALTHEEIAKLRTGFSDRPRVNTMHFTVHVSESGLRLQDHGRNYDQYQIAIDAPDDFLGRKERMIGIAQEIARATIGRELKESEVNVVNIGKAVARPERGTSEIQR